MKFLIFLISLHQSQNFADYEDEYDLMKSVQNVDIYFKGISDEDQKLEMNQVLDILLITFMDGSLEDVIEIERREGQKGKLTHKEDDLIHFYYILLHFFTSQYQDQNITKKILKKIIKNQEIKMFILDEVLVNKQTQQEGSILEELDDEVF